jgi:hypothetical protein
MSNKENLVKIQELAAAAVGLSEELEVAEHAMETARNQVLAIKANIEEVEMAISGLAVGLGK